MGLLSQENSEIVGEKPVTVLRNVSLANIQTGQVWQRNLIRDVMLE